MKLSTIFAAAAALMLSVSCGILGGGSNTATPTSNGQASGAALRNLYTQYKADGNKVDMTNISNILNLATLSQAVTELKDAGKVDKSDYVREFATGLILGSNNLVNQTNSTPVVSNLTNIAGIDLSSVTSAATALIANGITSAATQANAAQTQTAAATQQAQAQTTAAAQQTQAQTASTANAVTSALSQVSAASNEVSQAVSSLTSIFNLFK